MQWMRCDCSVQFPQSTICTTVVATQWRLFSRHLRRAPSYASIDIFKPGSFATTGSLLAAATRSAIIFVLVQRKKIRRHSAITQHPNTDQNAYSYTYGYTRCTHGEWQHNPHSNAQPILSLLVVLGVELPEEVAVVKQDVLRLAARRGRPWLIPDPLVYSPLAASTFRRAASVQREPIPCPIWPQRVEQRGAARRGWNLHPCRWDPSPTFPGHRIALGIITAYADCVICTGEVGLSAVTR
jgi:hypothetical protein